MFSRRLSILTGLLTCVIFMCTSCGLHFVHTSDEERFYKGERANIIDILRDSRDDMLNRDFDNALAKAYKAKKKSEDMNDHLMTMVSAAFINGIFVLMGDPGKYLMEVAKYNTKCIKEEGVQNCFYNILLIAYDIGSFNLYSDKRIIDIMRLFQLPDLDLLYKDDFIITDLLEAGEYRLANLYKSLFKSMRLLSKSIIDQDVENIIEYKRKVRNICDEILLIVNNKKSNIASDFMLKFIASFFKLYVVGMDKDIITYEKTARELAGIFDIMQESVY
ncbi:membrane protein [Candidatus Magnetobacterium bavaricum]|uniref:Membrane protein n=1 Tax=Candidatus Magnetobacterium bavaricum TaxID=29290 RepID=A0A0F3GJ43_9BACT|nr:membrane protein [Candidatus Magnetobacterium bavaricum]